MLVEDVELPRPEQLSLWELENPLKPQIPQAFFKTLPSTPGVYRLIDEYGEILYVGKAKNLRTRVRYYRSKTLMGSSRKLRELVRRVRQIEFETCETESAALVKENELLARLKPPYNVVNTRPEAYPYIGVRVGSHSLELKFAFETENFDSGFEIFGAYRATGQALLGFAALLRLVHSRLFPHTAWPLLMMRLKNPKSFTFEGLDPSQTELLSQDLRKLLLGELTLLAPREHSVHQGEFFRKWLELDSDRLKRLSASSWYLRCLREAFTVEASYVEKQKLNNLASLYSTICSTKDKTTDRSLNKQV